MHVLVTGGAGFIGSNIVEYLLNKNIKVSVIDNLSTGHLRNIEEFISNPNFRFINGDICDIETVRYSLNDIDCVCHQAALGSVPRSVNDPLTSHNNNVNGFLNILVVMKEKNIKRIVYASSSSVYGDNETLPKIESNIGTQLSPYAITKYIDELYANIFSKIYGLECIGLRYFNVFGKKQDPDGAYAAVIPKFITSVKNNIRPNINGDGSYSRDFTHISNVVDANYKALTTNNSECYGQVFNIGAGGRITILEMFNVIKNTMHKNDLEPIFGPVRIGDIPHSNADCTKAREYLNYEPLTDFYSGILNTINYY